jgi:flavin reductase (DIM6/NTAB) family NADH-FMN oxidoreductase RutF
MPDKDITREILRMFSYGLFVAASQSADGPHAATISWVTQASFEPRLVSVAMRKGTAICKAVESSRRFSLHVVGAEQQDFAKAFFKAHPATADEIGGYRYVTSENGIPVFASATAWLECEVVEVASDSGDHSVFISQILSSGLREPGTALALRDTPWHYGG